MKLYTRLYYILEYTILVYKNTSLYYNSYFQKLILNQFMSMNQDETVLKHNQGKLNFLYIWLMGAVKPISLSIDASDPRMFPRIGTKTLVVLKHGRIK